MKNIVSKINNSVHQLNNIFDKYEERITEVEEKP